MKQSEIVRLRVLTALVAFAAVAIPVAPVLGQVSPPTTTRIEIDTPAEGASVTNGVQILIGGWAADPTGPGTGVDLVRIYLDGPMDAGGRLLGSATTGVSRPDVAAATGNPALATSGFNYLWTPSGLSGGTHTIYVYAHAIATDTWAQKTVTVTVPAGPTPTPTPAGPQWGAPPGGGYPGGAPGPGYGGAGQGIPYPYDLYPPRPAYPPYGSPGYGYPGYGYPGYPYPGYTYPGSPGAPNPPVCIMIYPPPPGC